MLLFVPEGINVVMKVFMY